VKILVLDEELPYPLNTGKRIRSFNLHKRLAHKHELKYLAYGKENSESYQTFVKANMNPIVVENQVLEKNGFKFYFSLLLNFASHYPYIVTSHYSILYAEKIQETLAKFCPDIVIAEWSPYARYFTDFTGPKKIINTHNIETRIWERYYKNESNQFKKFYIKIQLDKLIKFEEIMLTWADAITAVTDNESDEFRNINGNIPVETIDNGVDIEYFKSKSDSNKLRLEGHRLVFTGSMDWRPNQDAVIYFIKEIFPQVKMKIPEIKFYVVGRNPPEHIVRLGDEHNVFITGTVDDIRPYIEQSDVYVVPLRIGGGSRLKILEAMSMEKIVLSTSIGAEGLEVEEGKNILIADNSNDFASRISSLLNGEMDTEKIILSARELVESRYSWSHIAQKYDNFLNRL